MAYKYSFQEYDNGKMARAVGISLPISFKQASEICKYLKNKSLSRAKASLERVMEKKEAIPFKRYSRDVGHKRGIAAGRYPFKASNEILKMLESAEKNAQSKGLSNLMVVHMNAHRAQPGGRTGRVPGEAKRAHVEVVLGEMKSETKVMKK